LKSLKIKYLKTYVHLFVKKNEQRLTVDDDENLLYRKKYVDTKN